MTAACTCITCTKVWPAARGFLLAQPSIHPTTLTNKRRRPHLATPHLSHLKPQLTWVRQTWIRRQARCHHTSCAVRKPSSSASHIQAASGCQPSGPEHPNLRPPKARQSARTKKLLCGSSFRAACGRRESLHDGLLVNVCPTKFPSVELGARRVRARSSPGSTNLSCLVCFLANSVVAAGR